MLRAIIISIMLVINACAHASIPLPVEAIGSQEGKLDGELIAVSGYLVKSPIGGLFLYESSAKAKVEDYSAGLDVVPTSKINDEIYSGLTEGRCAVVTGVFTAFTDTRLGMGYYRSKAGYVSAVRISFPESCTAIEE